MIQTEDDKKSPAACAAEDQKRDSLCQRQISLVISDKAKNENRSSDVDFIAQAALTTPSLCNEGNGITDSAVCQGAWLHVNGFFAGGRNNDPTDLTTTASIAMIMLYI